jgi:hypothetical protein
VALDEIVRELRIAAFENGLDLGVFSEQRRDHAAGQRLIVGDEDAEAGHAVARPSHAGGVIGTATSTLVPARSPRLTSRRAAPP